MPLKVTVPFTRTETHGGSMDSRSQPSDDHQQSGDQQPSAGTTPVPVPAPTPRLRKKILDLARYRLGQRVYWIVFRMDRGPEFHRLSVGAQNRPVIGA
jgi:hypothetical protein